MDEKTHECSLCGDQYEDFGHNAYPFDGRCCTTCNWSYVIPARMAMMARPKLMGLPKLQQEKAHELGFRSE